MRRSLVAIMLCSLTVHAHGRAFEAATLKPAACLEEAPRIQSQQKPECGFEDQEGSEAPEARPGYTLSAVPTPIPPDQHGEGAAQTEQGGEQGTEFWPSFLGLHLKLTDSIVAIFTAMLALFTFLLWRSTDKLWAAGERQIAVAMKAATAAEVSARAARDSQRPWIGFVRAEPAGRVSFQGESGELIVDISFRNYGQSIATDIAWRFASEAVAPGLASNWSERQALVLDGAVAGTATGPDDGFISLVPGQEHTIRAISLSFDVGGLTDYVVVTTGGCRYLIDGIPHWAGMVFTVIDDFAGKGEGIPVAHGQREPSQIKVVRAFNGGRVT